MNALRGFFTSFTGAIYNPAFYRSAADASVEKPLVYYFFFILLLTFITFSTVGIEIVKGVNQLAVDGANAVIASYPEDLALEIKDGEVHTTVSEPYFVRMSEEVAGSETDSPANLLVIDTSTPFSQDQFDDYDAAAWLTKDTLFIIDDDAQLRAINIAELGDFKVNKTIVEELHQKFSPWLRIVGPALAILLFVLFYMFHAWTLLYLLLIALLFWLITKVRSLHLSYRQVYKMSIYAATLGLILQAVIQIVRPLFHVPSIPFFFTIITLGVLVVNVGLNKAFRTDAPVVTPASSGKAEPSVTEPKAER